MAAAEEEEATVRVAATDIPTGTTREAAVMAPTTMIIPANMQPMGMRISPRYKHQRHSFGGFPPSRNFFVIKFYAQDECSGSA